MQFIKECPERRCALHDEERIHSCAKKLQEFLALPPRARLMSAQLLAVRSLDHVPQLKNIRPYYARFERHGGGFGWERYSAQYKRPGFERIYDFHAQDLTVEDYIEILNHPQTQRSYVGFKFFGTHDAVAEYVQSAYF